VKGTTRESPSLVTLLAAFGVLTFLFWGLYHASGLPVIGDHLTEIFALIFLFLPTLWFRLRGEEDFIRFGSVVKGMLWGLVVAAVLLSLYVLAHVLFFRHACATENPFLTLGRSCARYRGSFHWPMGAGATLNLVAVHLIAVALPEEFFYRGFLLPLLLTTPQIKSMKGRRPIIAALVLQAVLFGLGHALVDGNPLRMAVFFPGLIFGIVALRTRSLYAPILIHGFANVVSELLEKGWFN